MRERIRRDRGSGSEILDFKTGLGGIVEAEFLVQALQMRAGAWNPQFAFAVADLKQTWDSLCWMTRRRCNRATISCAAAKRSCGVGKTKASACLPADEGEQRKLARTNRRERPERVRRAIPGRARNDPRDLSALFR